MPRAIISLIGISLLTRNIEALLGEDNFNEFASTFLTGYNKTKHKKPKDIIKIIGPEEEKKLTGYLKDMLGPPNLAEASAETNSLSHMGLQQGDILYFLSSNTLPGKICAQALYRYYKDQNLYGLKEPITIQYLVKDTFNKGLREFTHRIVEIIRDEKGKGNKVIINATGGYKPESIYATLSGILEETKVKYIHEEFDSPVELPSIPVNFNLSIFHRNATWIRLAIKGNKQAYDKLPKELMDLITFNLGRDSPFKPLGEVLWNAYRFAISPRGRKFPDVGLIDKLKPKHQKKVFKFIEKWDSLWLGDQVPQMVDHEQSHCQDVLNLAEQTLLPILDKDENFLSQEELYYLISAIFLHDIGHAETIDEHDNILFPEDIRKRHGEFTYQMIKKKPRDFGFNGFNDEAKLIAKICKYHQMTYGLGNLPEEKNGIRVRFITALLRIFDACDRQKSRAGEEDYRQMRLHANEREKKLYQKILEQMNPRGRIKEFIESKIKFIEKQEEHFRIHSEISLVHIEPGRLDRRWTCKIIYHPIKKRGKIREFENYINKELNVPSVKETLADNSLKFEVREGDPLP